MGDRFSTNSALDAIRAVEAIRTVFRIRDRMRGNRNRQDTFRRDPSPSQATGGEVMSNQFRDRADKACAERDAAKHEANHLRAERDKLRDALYNLTSYALTCQSYNTYEWMDGLLERCNASCEAIGDKERWERFGEHFREI